ncbi:MAG: hypothetical protein Tsb005_07610 [Gammaproteobacteria bacterium]
MQIFNNLPSLIARIFSPSTTNSSIQPVQASAATTQWQPGQLLSALVTANAQAGIARLQIGSQTIHAQTALNLQQGDQLQLQVQTNQTNNVVLKLIDYQVNPQALRQQLLQLALPQQQSLQPLLTQLNLVNQQVQTGNPTVFVPPVSQAIHHLLRQLPSLQQVSSGDGLRQAIQNSGLFLEAQLAQQSGLPNQTTLPIFAQQDLKANLQRLLAVLQRQQPSDGQQSGQGQNATATGKPVLQQPPTQPSSSLFNTGLTQTDPTVPDALQTTRQLKLVSQSTPNSTPLSATSPENTLNRNPQALEQQVSAGIAKIQVQQAHALPQAQVDQQQVWITQLPIRHDQQIDLIDLRITREREEDNVTATDKTKQHRWTVNLYFDFPELGQLQAKISMHKQAVAITWWSEQSSTQHLVDSKLGELQQSLQASGLTVEQLQSFLGKNPQGHTDDRINQQFIDQHLVDTHI